MSHRAQAIDDEVKVTGFESLAAQAIRSETRARGYLATSILGLLIAACSAAPVESPAAPTSTAGQGAAASLAAASPSANATVAASPTLAASPTRLRGSFTLVTEPNVQKITAGGECLIDANEDWLEFDLLSPVGGEPILSIIIGRSEKNPSGTSVRGGGVFSGESLVIDGGTTAPSIPDATATVAADLRSAEITGVIASGNSRVTYTYAFTCTE